MKVIENRGYEAEVKQRWGGTEAYGEHNDKTANYTQDKWQEVNNGLNGIFIKFAECLKNGSSAGSAEAQAIVEKLKSHITENYYTCTNQILAGLGQMYTADERFKNNIDKCGKGTAEFVAEAICAYVKGIKNV